MSENNAHISDHTLFTKHVIHSNNIPPNNKKLEVGLMVSHFPVEGSNVWF